jgi:SAM-dependent methyltransferase
MKIPARVSWAVDLLKVNRNMRVLEIGCGRGFAAHALAPHLGVGGYVGIDRSKVAIQAARKLNAGVEERGIATFHLGEFGKLDLGAMRFDAILAINVNAFWTDEGEAAATSRALLKRRGKLLLVYELPSPARIGEITAATEANLQAGGFRLWTPVRPLDRSKAMLAVWARAG